MSRLFCGKRVVSMEFLFSVLLANLPFLSRLLRHIIKLRNTDSVGRLMKRKVVRSNLNYINKWWFYARMVNFTSLPLQFFVIWWYYTLSVLCLLCYTKKLNISIMWTITRYFKHENIENRSFSLVKLTTLTSQDKTLDEKSCFKTNDFKSSSQQLFSLWTCELDCE